MNFPLLLCLLGTIAVSSVATTMVRGAAQELDAETRDRVARAESKAARFWRGIDWVGIGLILLAMFLPQMMLFTKSSQRVLTIAAGLAVFCISNAAAAWHTASVYKRETQSTNARATARNGATLVTVAEVILLAVVFWIVSGRLDWFSTTKPDAPTPETSGEESEPSGNWMDESIALKELSALDKDYIEGVIASGTLHTKMVGGKKMYRVRDVEALKNTKPDSFK